MVQGVVAVQSENEEKENLNVVFNFDDKYDIQKQQQQQQKSLLNSSPTALAKFNRIIDTTVPITNVYQPQQQQPHEEEEERSIMTTTATLLELDKRIALAYRNIVSTDSITTSTTTSATLATRTSETITTLTLKTEMQNEAELESADDNNYLYQYNRNNPTDNNKMKRNDVHYLLKQLNSFSDIEEIEIVDNMQQQNKRQRQQYEHEEQQQQQQQQQQEQDKDKYSPTTQSLVLLSPSAVSHKGIRRYASLHQQETSTTSCVARERVRVAASLSQQAVAAAGGADVVGGVQQFDDYLFQSCHYLETNYFAANYRTAMVESCSHEFRPSTTTGTRSASYSSHSSLHTFDKHEAEPPSVICKATTLPQKELDVAEEEVEIEFEIYDDELEHELEQAVEEDEENLQPYVKYAQQPPALGPPPRRFQMQARLTSSGVQTELTTSSLSTAATNASLAKSSTLSQHTTSTTSSTEAAAAARCRRKPFFKCCYTPIDRWRERRSAAAAAAAAQQQQQTKRPTVSSSCSETVAASKKKEAAAGSAV